MLRELLAGIVFLLIVSGILGSLVVIQKMSTKQADYVNKIIEVRNAND